VGPRWGPRRRAAPGKAAQRSSRSAPRRRSGRPERNRRAASTAGCSAGSTTGASASLLGQSSGQAQFGIVRRVAERPLASPLRIGLPVASGAADLPEAGRAEPSDGPPPLAIGFARASARPRRSCRDRRQRRRVDQEERSGGSEVFRAQPVALEHARTRASAIVDPKTERTKRSSSEGGARPVRARRPLRCAGLASRDQRARSSNLVRPFMKTRSTLPVGPLRCLATMSSATFSFSGVGLYWSSR